MFQVCFWKSVVKYDISSFFIIVCEFLSSSGMHHLYKLKLPIGITIKFSLYHRNIYIEEALSTGVVTIVHTFFEN